MNEDFHFVGLAKALKGNTHLHFSDVMAWYTEHYMMNRHPENPLYYAEPLRHLIVGYIERNKFTTMLELTKRLSPNNWMKCKFEDLSEDVNEAYDMRVIVECCGIIRLLHVSRIPGYEI